MEYFFFGFVAACVLIAAIQFFHGQSLDLNPGQVRKISIGNMNFGEHEITKVEWVREKFGEEWGWEFRILAEPKFQKSKELKEQKTC